MRIIGYRTQRTIARTVGLDGVGFITGARVRCRFLPADPNAGLRFRRADLPGKPETIARPDLVSGTQRRTTLGPPETGVTLVEHALAALAGLRIDNCVVELDGPEPPGLDGSAAGFVESLLAAGAAAQGARRPIYSVAEPVVIRSPGSTLALHPAATPELRASYLLNYGPGAPIAPQVHTLRLCPAAFASDLCRCRTFLTVAEATHLRELGIGRHLSASDLLVFGPRGPIDNVARYADEPARHKLLDLIGDLALCGFDLAGHLVAYRSGHAMNVELARTLVASVGGGGRKVGRRKSPAAVRQAA